MCMYISFCHSPDKSTHDCSLLFITNTTMARYKSRTLVDIVGLRGEFCSWNFSKWKCITTCSGLTKFYCQLVKFEKWKCLWHYGIWWMSDAPVQGVRTPPWVQGLLWTFRRWPKQRQCETGIEGCALCLQTVRDNCRKIHNPQWGAADDCIPTHHTKYSDPGTMKKLHTCPWWVHKFGNGPDCFWKIILRWSLMFLMSSEVLVALSNY